MNSCRDFRSSNRSDSLYSGSYCFLAGDGKTSHIFGIGYMCTSTKLNRNNIFCMIKNSHDTHDITIFIFKERLGSHLDCLIIRRFVHFDRVSIIDHLIDVIFNFVNLFWT